jgi:hypothetical protein
MEIAWEDRGKIPFEVYRSSKFKWENVHSTAKIGWCEVFDSCKSAETITVAGGDTVLIVKDGE